VYEETLTGRPHDTPLQKAPSVNENVEFNVMTWTSLGVDTVQRHKRIEHIFRKSVVDVAK